MLNNGPSSLDGGRRGPRSALLLPREAPVLVALVSMLLATSSPAAEDAPSDAPSDDPARAAPILIDWIHANDFSMIGLRPGVYDYHATCGFRHGFEYLESVGVAHRYVGDGRLTAKRLAAHKLLFVNLVSAERQPFLVSEILAIRWFVEQGGSLLVITDHSNCYYHAHRLQPLFEELDIRSFTGTACDVPPRTLSSGNGWISVTQFKPHPITADLACLGIQTGGRVDDRFGVATTSAASWEDAWETNSYGEKNGPSFFGDLVRAPGEPAGPLAVVMAKNLGEGRIVVVADQNMFSDAFINYADNWRLWLNTMAWLLGDERLRRPDRYQRWRSPRIALYEQYDRAAFGRDDQGGFYHAMCVLNRRHWTFANDRPSQSADLLVLARSDYQPTPRLLATLVGHLRRGKNVLFLSVQGDVLDDKRELVARVLRELNVTNPVVHRLPEKLVIEGPSGGDVHLLSPAAGVDNVSLPPPTEFPTSDERERAEVLLRAVREACGE